MEAEGVPNGGSVRIERLLAHHNPDSADHALVRFAAEKVVADLPDAGFEEHEVFLNAKLDEARLVEVSLEKLAALGSAMEEPAETAADALRLARFDDMDAALANAESAGAEPAVRVAARSARAETALLRGDSTLAAAHFVAAAGYFKEEDDLESQKETRLFRSRAVGRLIQHADSFGGNGDWIDDAMDLCDANIRCGDTHPWNQGARQMDAGQAQLSAGRLKDGYEALDLFMAAEYAFRIASWRFGKDRFPEDWAAAQNARGLANAQFCFRYEEIVGEPVPEGGWKSSEVYYIYALEVQWEAGLSLEWAKTRINLGYLLARRGRAEGGEAGRRFLNQAVDHCRGAQQALRPDIEGAVWVDAQQILAEALLDLADIDPVQARDHLRQAKVELTAAQDFLASEDLPLLSVRATRLMERLQREKEGLGEA